MLRGDFPWHRPPGQVCPEASLPRLVRDPHLHLRQVQVSVAEDRSLRVT